MADFFVYAVLLSDAAVDVLTTSLIRAGYTVGPAASSNELSWPGEASTMTALKLSKKVEAKDGKAVKNVVLDAVSGILNKRGIVWHCLIVQHGESSTWKQSNIKLPRTETKTALERAASKESDEIG